MDTRRLNIAQARKLAKDLLKSGDQSRFLTSHPEFAKGVQRPPKLSDAQWVVARKAGFESWARLKHALERRDSDRARNAAALIESALDGDLPRSVSLLDSDGDLSAQDFATALVTGDVEVVEELLGEDPTQARGTYSRRKLPPLFLCTRSALAARGREGDFAGCARALCAAGCDVNQRIAFDPPWQGSNGSPLYYAAGFHGNRELAKALLDLGASPNDAETLYHSVEKNDPELLRLLHPYNRDMGEWSYAFIHLMDFESPEAARTMLELGVDLTHRHPQSGETALHWAVKNGRSPKTLTMLLQAGADPAAKDAGGMGAYARAARSGDAAAAGAMERFGYREELDGMSRLMLAAALLDSAGVAAVVAETPNIWERVGTCESSALHRAAAGGRVGAVRGLIRLARFDPAVRDETGATALHHACLNGEVEVVRELVQAGAPLNIKDYTHESSPIGWTCWASENPPFADRQRELAEIAAMLLRAGSDSPVGLSGSEGIMEVLMREGGG